MNNPDDHELSDAETEARVRRSLGLSAAPTTSHQAGPSQAQHHTGHTSTASVHQGHAGHNQAGQSHYGQNGGMPRRRFVRDGEVPVVVLHPKSEADSRHAATIADLTRQRDSERAARLRAEQSLQDALATIQSLQTRLAHADLARDERRDHDVELQANAPDAAPFEPVDLDVPAPAQSVREADAQAGNAPAMAEEARSDRSEETRPTRRRRTKRFEPVDPPDAEPVKWWRDPDDADA